MTSQYIYLLQEREFIKTKEQIYKIGMTRKENHERFNQYPKGSVLLFQMICINSKSIESLIIKIFKEQFKQRKDIGNEYFEGDFNKMTDIIYSNIKNEKEMCEDIEIIEDNDEDDNDEDDDDEEGKKYEITTYDEWIKYNEISNVIIINKSGKGYLRFKGQLWRKLYDKNMFGFDENKMEHLKDFIINNQPIVSKIIHPNNMLVSNTEMMNLLYKYRNNETNAIINWEEYRKIVGNEIKKNEDKFTCLENVDKYKFVHVEFNEDKIFQDTVKKCYVKSYDFYNLKYHEYIFAEETDSSSVSYVVFNSVDFTFISVDNLIENKIITDEYCGQRSIYVKNIINIEIVDDIINSLITNEIKLIYKKLVFNLLVKQEEPIVFYDKGEYCYLTIWIRDLLYSISGTRLYVDAVNYIENKSKFKKLLKTEKPRCVIIQKRDYTSLISLQKYIDDFHKLGFKNIIVCQNDKNNNMYNVINFRKYLQDNKETLIRCIKEENNYELENIWESEIIKEDDQIFFRTNLFLTNFLKWCCKI